MCAGPTYLARGQHCGLARPHVGGGIQVVGLDAGVVVLVSAWRVVHLLCTDLNASVFWVQWREVR